MLGWDDNLAESENPAKSSHESVRQRPPLLVFTRRSTMHENYLRFVLQKLNTLEGILVRTAKLCCLTYELAKVIFYNVC